MPAPLKWVSTPSLGQGRASGGSAAAELFEGGSAQRRRPLLETLVREVCQNTCDRRLGNATAGLYFDLLLISGDERDRLPKNVTGLGRWGNGDVELGVAILEEVPYAIGLIRQSLERQRDDAPSTQ